MEQFFEFAINHWILVSILIALLVALFVTESAKSGKSLSTHQATQLINSKDAVVVDIREHKDFSNGHIVNAINIPFSKLKGRLSELDKFKDKPIIIVCQMGQNSGSAGKELKNAGFENVHRLGGGISEWTNSNLPLVAK